MQQQDLAATIIATTTILMCTTICAIKFKDALVLLLNGHDIQRDRFMGNARFKRQANARKVPSIKTAKLDILRMGYEQRAHSELQKRVRMVDLGQFAGQTRHQDCEP